MRTIKKLMGFSLGPILGAVLSSISVPISTHFLFPDEYGKTSMFNLMYTVVLLVAYLGYDQAYIREYHEHTEKGKVLYNAMFIPTIVTIILMLLIALFPGQISYILFETKEHKDVVYMFAGVLPFVIAERFILVNIRMQEKALEYSFFSLIIKVIAFAFTMFFLLKIRQDFLAIVYSTLLSHYIGDSILIAIYHNVFKVDKNMLDLDLITQMSKYALPLVPATVVGSVFNGEDKMFIRFFSDYTELGYYQVAMILANMILILQQAFSTFWTPTVFRWKAEGVANERFEFVQKAVMLFASACFMIIMMVKDFLPILLSQKYENTKHILPFLLLYPVMSMVISTTVSGIDFARKTQFTLYFSIIVTAVNFILNWILVPRYGAIGAAIATGISHVFYFWIRTLYSRKLWFKFKLDHLILSTILLTIAAMVNSIEILNEFIIWSINSGIIICGFFVYRKFIIDIFINYIFKRQNRKTNY